MRFDAVGRGWSVLAPLRELPDEVEVEEGAHRGKPGRVGGHGAEADVQSSSRVSKSSGGPFTGCGW